MCILSVWEVGGVHKTICKVPTLQEDEVLQQGMPEECLGLPQTLVCSGDSMIVHQLSKRTT